MNSIALCPTSPIVSRVNLTSDFKILSSNGFAATDPLALAVADCSAACEAITFTVSPNRPLISSIASACYAACDFIPTRELPVHEF